MFELRQNSRLRLVDMSQIRRFFASAALAFVAMVAVAMPARGDLTITIFGTPGAGECYWKFEGSSNSQWRSDYGLTNDLYSDFPSNIFSGLTADFFYAPGGAMVPVASMGGTEVFAFKKDYGRLVLIVSGLHCDQVCYKTVKGNRKTRIVYQDITGVTEGVHTFGDTTINVIYCASGDSDGDGIPDDCDQCPGSDDWDDWDHNGVPDGCELDAPYSIRFSDVGTVYCDGQSYFMNSQSYFPSASSDVTITCTMDTLGMTAADAYVEVFGNGMLLGTVFDGEIAGECGQSASITVSSADWDTARQPNGGVQIELRATASVVCTSCSFFSNSHVDVAYMADRDVDDNGVVDVRPGNCDPTGADADGDGVGDACDLCTNTAAGTPVDGDGCTLAPTNADLDRDGDVDDLDMDGFFTCASGPGSPVGADCPSFDLNADGTVDLLDYLAVQDSASGDGMVAEALSAGTILPRYFGADIGHALSFDNAARMCQLRYGSTLAMIDRELPVEEQQSRIDEMTAIANGLGGGGYWIGLKYNHETQRFTWRDGSKLIPEGGDAANWWNGQTPTASDFISGRDSYYVYLWDTAGYKWLNYGDEEFLSGFDPTGCMCDAPDVFGQGMPAGEEGGDDVLDVQIISNGNNSILVGPGETVTYFVIGALDNAENEGLAGFAFDLSFDGGDLSPVTVPTGMESFAAPLGHTNSTGFGGTLVNGDLIQVGGGQNTINNNGPDGPTGVVSTGIGHSATILATGTFVAPTTLGTYTLSLSNLDATTINAGQTGTPVWRCEPALPGTVVSLTVEVCADGDADHDGICDEIDSCITANDDCVDAAPIGDETVFGCTSDATNDGFATCGSSHFSPDVWYAYTAAFDGTATVDTCGSGTNFDSVLSVHDGCDGAQIKCDKDGCGFPSNSSRITWDIVEGQEYLIRVAGWFGVTGNFELTVDSTPYPANDDCSGALAISAGTYIGSTATAKIDSTGPCATQSVRDVWFAYTNSTGVDVELIVDLCNAGTTADTILGAYDACGGAEIVCNDDAGVCAANGFASSMNWVVPCGQTHLIRVATNINRPGNEFELAMSEVLVGQDSDGDGVGDACDVCPGSDDNIDTNGNGIPDGCEAPCGDLRLGDTNGDGIVNVADATDFSSVMLDSASATADELCTADVNQDGNIDGLDVQAFVNLLLVQ